MLPAELQDLIDQVDAAEADARTLVRGLDDRQANWQPDGGQAWSIAQCLDHLARMNSFYVEAVLPRVRRAAEGSVAPFESLAPTWLGRKFVESMEPPVTRRFKVPAARVAPASDMPVADALAAFGNSHTRYRELVRLCAGLDPNRVRVPNPFFKWVWMRASTVLLVIPAHDRRHLWQARRVLARPDFPSTAVH
ncbi:MAG: DinB family protein [Acidobacteria bacterium]|nr:DinB family protein [Acidobacteriota bacterium]